MSTVCIYKECVRVYWGIQYTVCVCSVYNIGYSTICTSIYDRSGGGGGEIRGNLLRSLYIYIRRGGVTVHAKISCPIERHEPGYRYAIPKSGPK